MLSCFSHVCLFATLMDYSLPGSSVHRILQARILKWAAMPSSRGSSQTRDWTCVSLTLVGGNFTSSTTWETRQWQYMSCFPKYILGWRIIFKNHIFMIPKISEAVTWIEFFKVYMQLPFPLHPSRQQLQQLRLNQETSVVLVGLGFSQRVLQ